MPHPHASVRPSDSPREDCLILIVDDDPTSVSLLRRILTHSGYRRILGTTDPQQAYDLVAQHQPALLLLDLNMPRKNGFEVLRELHERLPPEAAPLALIMTAADDRDSRLSALKLGARDYIVKPYDPHEILLRVKNLLEIQQKRRLFANLLDSTPAAMLAHDRNGCCTFVNRSALILLGYERADQVVGETIQHLIFDPGADDATSSDTRCPITAAATLGSPVYRPVIRMRRADGAALYVEYWAYPVCDDVRQGGALVTFFDVGARLASEQDQRLAGRVFEHVDRALIITDATGHIVSANPAYTQLTGWTREEVLGKNPRFRRSDRHDDAFYRQMWRALLEDGSWEGEIWNRRKDGSCYLEELSITTVRDAEGTITNFVAAARDLTEDRRYQQELRDARQRAEAANQAKTQFVANMSHEIRTPLTAILGYAETLADPRQSPASSEESIAAILRNGHYLLELVNEILDFSKIEAGCLDIERVSTPLAELLTGIAALASERARAKGLEFALIVEPPWPHTLVTDPTRAKQILINLLSNAVKFTERGWVRLRIRLDSEHETLICAVEDSGIGIAADRLPLIFDSFVQADVSTVRTHGGSGLGLTIAKKLAQRLGGDLTVDSTPGAGSVFTATLATGPLSDTRLEHRPPKVSPKARVTSDSDPDAIPQLRGQVLLAEDNVDNRKLIRAFIESTGAQVLEAENGQQAFDLAQQQTFDLVLMDMQMPLMDGLEATELLRLSGFDEPIVALTANATLNDRQAALEAGCTDFLIKPLQTARFFAALAEHLPASDASPDLARLPVEMRIDLEDLSADFRRRLPEYLDQLAQAAAIEDTSTLARLAHQLKGAAGNFGLPEVTRIAGRLETAARAADRQAISSQLEDLQQLWQDLQP